MKVKYPSELAYKLHTTPLTKFVPCFLRSNTGYTKYGFRSLSEISESVYSILQCGIQLHYHPKPWGRTRPWKGEKSYFEVFLLLTGSDALMCGICDPYTPETWKKYVDVYNDITLATLTTTHCLSTSETLEQFMESYWGK